MGILDFTAAANATTRSANTADRPVAKVWLNVGYDVQIKNEKGETETRFINLPVGIPVDTMEALPIRGQNEGYAQMRAAQNSLLEQLQGAGDNLRPGEEVEVRLTLKLRKANEQLAINNDENPMSINLASLIVSKNEEPIADVG